MKQFSSIEKLDTGILYALELASSLSVLLLAFGLIASMANVLTKGSVLTDNLIMQRICAWTQCIAIDASVAGTIIRTFRYHREGEKVITWLYGLLSALLLFTAAIVSNPDMLHITETAVGTDTVSEELEKKTTTPTALFPGVPDKERNKVIEAYKQGIPRREICSYLLWGNAKYSTIVKPVLDNYE